MTGRLASLNRFISRSAEKSLPFFKVLKGTENFHWGPEQDKAFEDLKKYLENLAVMRSPSPGAELLLYIATSSSAVSAALVEERMVEGTLKQLPFYFVSEALNGSKLLYSKMEKNGLCSGNGSQEASPLFSEFQDQGRDIFSPSVHV